MDSSTTHQYLSVDDKKKLQDFIWSLIHPVIEPAHAQFILDELSMDKYWIPAFTHVSFDATQGKNYEQLEFYGDKTLNHAFLAYIREVFDNKINPQQGTLMLNKYMSKMFQAGLATKLKLTDYVRYDAKIHDATVHIREDVFEAFIGAFEQCTDERIQKGLGYVYCFNYIALLFNNISINIEDVKKDDVTQLKELFEKLNWGEPNYIKSSSEDPSKGEYRTDIRTVTGDIIGTGYGSESGSRIIAATMAIRYLAGKGYTLEIAENKRVTQNRKQNPELDLQYRRIDEAIKVLNTRNPNDQIIKFTIKQLNTQHTAAGLLYLFALNVAYKDGDKLRWRTISQKTGTEARSRYRWRCG